ncbi:hypothetical protein ZYGR_0S00470 [Zygosaccharomyces rouxii]|uniref:ZYRO0F03498p n=2 Tax=Zygosaccharomyces rouxii TaxID=4956 RepID=C5DXA6_ZYGRC|nr:uncharacterized protein ZYRO0F03498g [Zygosaccharomyces rouxii]KAH9199181.1 Fcf2 pre-rRNA processing-domain-containing protein [Zygosaccharomyces rouxii]GAV49914.1 hypothetical protein ZYGR_0S00470 [Zygosaccharomyces rouxii]CAR28417.1 ZYRO0F03498p [Zygosaccharomyces rouxii]
MDEVESLFRQLEQVNARPESNPSAKENGLQENQDLVKLDDEHAHDGFESIEKSLKQLPKLQNGFDKLDAPKAVESKSYAVGKEKKNQHEGPTNEEWFTLPTPTGEFAHRVQRDLQLIKHRASLDPKRHYKKEKWNAPERFAVGTIIEDKSEYFSGRLPRRQRGETMLSTLLKDVDSRSYLKRKYGEIQTEKRGKRFGKNKKKGKR